MVNVKDAPRTSTTIIVRSDSNSRITRSRDPFYELMSRVFQEGTTATRGQKFLLMVEKRQAEGNPIKTNEWENICEELNVTRSSFYAMKNKLTGAGLISVTKREYRLSGLFSLDLLDMARWWWSAILHQPEEKLQ